MKIFYWLILAVLVFLAISAGGTKVMLMQQDVEFFGRYGFTNTMLIVFGVAQLLGGVLLIWLKTRAVGAIIVAITFLVSAVILVFAGSYPLAIVTAICVSALGYIVRQSIISGRTAGNARGVHPTVGPGGG